MPVEKGWLVEMSAGTCSNLAALCTCSRDSLNRGLQRVGVGGQKAGPLALAFSYQPLRLMVRRRLIEVALVIPPNMQAGVPQ